MTAQALAKSVPAPAAAKGEPPAAGDGAPVARPDAANGIRFSDSIMIWPDARLAQFDVPGAQAFAATDTVKGDDRLVAYICERISLRWDVLERLRDGRCAELMQVVAWGNVTRPARQEHQHSSVLIYQRPGGARLIADLEATVAPMGDLDVVRQILMPAASALAHLSARGVVHRGIRPNNLYFRETARHGIMLGDCAVGPPAYGQPALFESIESAMAHPAGRGPGNRRNDLYSLGATVLFLLLGRKPAPHLNEEELLTARLTHGSYATLVGREAIPNSLREPLRGMLHDDPSQRWDLDDLSRWLLDRRVKPLSPQHDQKAQRAFPLDGENYYTCRSLGHAVAKNWRANVMSSRRADLLAWIERSLADSARGEAVTRAYEQLPGMVSMAGANTAIFNARLAIALDPQAPIRYKDFVATIDGIGPALAEGFGDTARVQEFAEIVLGGLPIFWLDMQRNGERDITRAAGVFRRLASFLKDPRPGAGVERCLYELNPGQHCLSPLVEKARVTTIGNLLPALEAIAKAHTEGMPFDRHIAAFVAARFTEDMTKPLTYLTARDNPRHFALGLLAMLATLQWRLGPPVLPELTRWMGHHLQPVVAGFHHRDSRKRVETQLPKLIANGNLSDIYNFLMTSDIRRRDDTGFAAAVARYAKIEGEVAFIESGGASDPVRARNYGHRMAAACSAVIGAVALILITLSRL